MATVMPLRTEFEEISLTLEGIQVRPGLKLLRMSDSTFNFYVDGPDRYVLHFKNANVFGKEFAILEPGSNSFTLLTPSTVSTPCYVWSEVQLAKILAGSEEELKQTPRARNRAMSFVEPMTRPIPIPPGR